MNKINVKKSDKQKTLEQNGCVFRGQEALDNHELDINKPCYCKRPFRRKTLGETKHWGDNDIT